MLDIAAKADARLAVRGEAAAVLDIAAKADAITNLYVKAPEDRTMDVESFGFKEYLHAMSVPAEIRSMVA